MLLESARHAGDLAAAAKSTATADRVYIDTERSGGFQQAGVFWKLAPLSRWQKEYFDLLGGHLCALASSAS